jgi:hypothetical protein
MSSTVQLSASQIGSTACVILGPQEFTRVYYQAADGSIHERKGQGPAVTSKNYTDQMLIPPGIARVNTPLAAVGYGGMRNGHFGEVSCGV